MNFTREPIIETVISSKEGYKLALRNSKGGGQEEFFVDAVEVISFGSNCFYRSLEKPKSFLVPVSDYEVLEVREARMVLKSSSVDRGIKIGGGRETSKKTAREESAEPASIKEVEATVVEEQKVEKRRERRRTRKRRGQDEEDKGEEAVSQEEGKPVEKPSLIPPPSTLISETISRYKDIVIHETPEEESSLKKEQEFSEEPSEDSSVPSPEAPAPQAVEDDEEIPI
ncbi:MAG: hypothetical protein S4CHLAM2_12780 [Chlamydiales bacterium]|nr:hypothetical protein [Chlamydiales bacterium]